MNKKIGSIGEQLAVNYMEAKEYAILDRNYRSKIGEIDIVARKNNTLVFVEVKTRTSDAFGLPSESVNYKKQQTIRKLSEQYILYKRLNNHDLDYRFDVIEVRILGKQYKIKHIENAF